MKGPKYDGVLEAAHYAPDGKLEWVRVYQRRGAAFSDRMILNRDQFVDVLKKGKTFYVGKRIMLMGSSFEVSQPVRLEQNDGRSVIVVGEGQPGQDRLEGVPVI